MLLNLGSSFLSIDAKQKGSNTAPSVIPYFTFRANDSNKLPPYDNEMLPFGFFKNGFGLQDSTTTCTFKSIFPVSGPISLHGGQLFMNTDLILQSPATIVSTGFFNGNGHVLDLSTSVTSFPTPFKTTLSNIHLSLNADINITGTVLIRGKCTIDGRLNHLIFGPNAQIQIDSKASL